MKTDIEVQEVTQSNSTKTVEFRMKNSAHAFRVLSSQIYSNKIRAIIRELSTNCIDSHVAAGNKDKPYDVHLPSMLEPWFSIRDYGTGLSSKEIVNIYSTYFESSKTDSDDFIGALGLGSKSPFSYTNNFTIVGIKDNKKSIFTAFVNENGIPSLSKMVEESSDESTGLEIKFGIENPSDFSTFKYESAEVFKWFKVQPNFIGGIKPQISTNIYKDKNIVKGIHLGTENTSVALMGNIPYPMNKIPQPEKHFGHLAHYLRHPLIIDFNIGDLGFASSREELSYTTKTIDSVKKKLQALDKGIYDSVKKEADKISNLWTRFISLEKKNTSSIYTESLKTYAKTLPFPFHGHFYVELPIKLGQLAENGLSVTRWTSTSSKKHKLTVYDKTSKDLPLSFTIKEHSYFVIDDDKNCIRKAKHKYSGYGHSVCVIHHTSTDKKTRDDDIATFLKMLHSPPNVVNSSLLEMPPSKPKTITSNGILAYNSNQSTSYYQRRVPAVWHLLTDIDKVDILDDTKTHYYLELENLSAFDSDRTVLNVPSLMKRIRDSEIPEFKNIKLYGVRKSKINEIKQFKNWINLHDFILSVLNKVDSNQLVSVIASNHISASCINTYPSMINSLDINSPYFKFIKKYETKLTIDVGTVNSLCKHYKISTIDLLKVEKEIEDEIKQINNRYPLVQHLYNLGKREQKLVADYIALIDKTN